MAEIDYQTALLLQYKFDQEYKINSSDYKLALELQKQFQSETNNAKKPPTFPSPSGNKSVNSDYQLALELQEQFKKEVEVERPANNLVYEKKKSTVGDPSKCLVDPSWEVIDPTPDVHVLFMAFNDRFFWGTLASVVVSWSKRMTTCAGICSYQGRGGMCSITLSEPLLKLRPRKDLVETLLHEMIHAYLFITNNNRDRDGHGPEFHKHMYRINKEAGTNISVYHDFHDEVRLYQQHWWRCDGPCQQWKPYFGMVRRATNRAPGPYDRWWNDHTAKCGGTFIKVKEPEKSTKKETNKSKNNETFGDIRKYISVTNNSSSNNEKFTQTVNKTNRNVASDVQGFSAKNTGTANISNVIPSKSSNIVGFTNLNGPTRKSGSVRNSGSNTIVVNKKPSTTTSTSTSTKSFNGTGYTTGSTKPSDDKDYATVRNHWLNKFDNTGGGIKRTSGALSTPPQKLPKMNETQCPVCDRKVPADDLNRHLDKCLEETDKIDKQCDNLVDDVFEEEINKICPACKAAVNQNEYDLHLERCLLSMMDDVVEKYQIKEEKTSCLACGKEIVKSELDVHLEDCFNMSNVFDTSNVAVEDTPGTSKEDRSNCPFCLKLIPESRMQSHLDVCLNEVDLCPEVELNKSIVIDSFNSDV